MQHGDIWLGLIPGGTMKMCAQTIALHLQETLWPIALPKPCPNPTKYPCKACKTCFVLNLNLELNRNVCTKLVQGVHRSWTQRCKLGGCRGVGSTPTAPMATPQSPQPQHTTAPVQRKPKRKRRVDERETLFLEVLAHVKRHKTCGLCCSKLPRFEHCVCVNDSKHQVFVNLGREIWGGG